MPRAVQHGSRAPAATRAAARAAARAAGGCAALALAALLPRIAAADPVHHEITVAVEPAAGLVRAVDRMTLPPEAIGPDHTVRFSLHGELHLTDSGPGAVALETPAGGGPDAGGSARAVYVAQMPAGERRLVLAYEGILSDPEADADTPGVIDRAGVLLGGATHWYPQLVGPGADTLLNFDLTARLPKGWDGVSQGVRTRKEEGPEYNVVGWREDNPQEEIHLVAAPFTLYVQPAGPTEGMVFLRAPDEALADRYLTAIARYVALYAHLIGPYPYAKFALVENRWETGLGLPSFTLMGPTVLRLKFIADTSFPHEILHDWWGNGVYVKPEGGNWAEGLTVYMADHLLAERQGQGPQYRRETLQRYADYVRTGSDFPLTDFAARIDEVTQAVGYGKAMMLFHMLRRRLGDQTFLAAVRAFYRDHRFARAGWDDLTAAFSAAAGEDLRPFMRAWLPTTGAPALELEDARAAPEGDGFRLTATLRQTQGGTAFPLVVPLAVTLEGEAQADWRTVPMAAATAPVTLTFPRRPLRVDVDPDFDLFRRLAPGEVPPAISGLLGAEHTVFVLPSAAPEDLLTAYGRLAAAWGGGGGAPGVTTVLDSDLKVLPAGGAAVWVLGWENRFARAAADAVATRGDLILTGDGFVLSGAAHLKAVDSAVFAGTAPGSGAPLGWLASAIPAAVNGLAHKVPHYGKYGYLVFRGDAPDNIAKGQWAPGDSALAVPVAGPDGTRLAVPRAALPVRPALAP
jgi:Peptidase family M1 domain